MTPKNGKKNTKPRPGCHAWTPFAEVPIGYWEWSDGDWVRGSAPTAGLSMPSYLFEDRIPHPIRGVFTISQPTGDKTLYHEMGHKLINVSHEGAGPRQRRRVQLSAADWWRS